jgi:hypothetical protein
VEGGESLQLIGWEVSLRHVGSVAFRSSFGKERGQRE